MSITGADFKRRAAILAGALLVALPAATASAQQLETARFKVSVKGVQTTAWEYDAPGGGRCHAAVSGEGTEVVRFSSRPKLLTATRFSPTFVQFGSGQFAGLFSAKAKVTRQARHVSAPLEPGCVDPNGGGEIRAPDCGTKRAVMDLRLSYEGFGRPRGVKLRSAGTAGDPFENCGVNGVGFPALLDRTTTGRGIASDWPVREIMDRRVGQTIVIGRGKHLYEDEGSRQETTIRWEITFRRVGQREGS